MIDCLQSPNCHLAELELQGEFLWSYSFLDPLYRLATKFRRAIRVSNVQKLTLGEHMLPFFKAFADEWFWVMIAITSVHHVPRLRRQNCPLGMIPVGTFLPIIVDTLGWPLDQLR